MKNKEIDEVLSEIDKLMDDVVDKAFQYTQENLLDDNKVDTGTLLQTGNVNRNFLYKQIVYPASYADVVNYGRNPGSLPPPVEALLPWVKRKLNVRDAKEAKSVAFAISKAISQRGIQPTFFIDNAVNQVVSEYA